MNLSNKTTGCIAKIGRWNLTNCDLNFYENGKLFELGTISKTKSYRINPDLSAFGNSEKEISESIKEIIYAQLLTLYPEFEGFETTDDDSNWLFTSHPIRLTIKREFADASMDDLTDIGKLFISMLPSIAPEYRKRSDNYITVYLAYLYDTEEMPHRQLLEAYPEQVFIE